MLQNIIRKNFVFLIVCLLFIGFGIPAYADLQLIQPDESIGVTFFGRGGYSADGLGQTETGNVISAKIPEGSKIIQSYLYAATFEGEDKHIDIDFDGSIIRLEELKNKEGMEQLKSFRADITSEVISKIGNNYGKIDFPINNDPENLDGIALVVIFQNPNLPETSIAVLDGGLSSEKTFTSVNLVKSIDKNDPKFNATLSLGISFGLQSNSINGTHECGQDSPQSTIIEINSKLLTSCAGNADDSIGVTANGNLITIGGVDDDFVNPSDPTQQPADGQQNRIIDDELYSLVPLLNNGDKNIIINTHNPSEDDLVFLAIVSITERASFAAGEICGDGLDNNNDGVVDENCELRLVPTDYDTDTNIDLNREITNTQETVALSVAVASGTISTGIGITVALKGSVQALQGVQSAIQNIQNPSQNIHSGKESLEQQSSNSHDQSSTQDFEHGVDTTVSYDTNITFDLEAGLENE